MARESGPRTWSSSSRPARIGRTRPTSCSRCSAPTSSASVGSSNHDARDRASLVDLGRVGDVPVLLNREWVEADVRITTGFVEPHFFAGFSGGPKMVAPGLAGLDTVLALHDARRIGDPRATWGVIEGNPVHDAVRAIAAATGVDFALDVLLNDEQRITQRVRRRAVRDACRGAGRGARPRRCSRSSGRSTSWSPPTAATRSTRTSTRPSRAWRPRRRSTRPGGTIICAAECRDGLPGPRLLRPAAGRARHARPNCWTMIAGLARRPIPDQWQVQIQARIQVAHEVLLKTDGPQR